MTRTIFLIACLFFTATFAQSCVDPAPIVPHHSHMSLPAQFLCPAYKIGVSHYACSPLVNSPVCAVYNNGTKKTFANACFACANQDDLRYYNNFSCPASMNASATSNSSSNSSSSSVSSSESSQNMTHSSAPAELLCPPLSVGVSHYACSSQDVEPVCAVYNNGTAKTFENSCFACADRSELKYYNDFACAAPADQQEHCPIVIGVSFIPCNSLPNNTVCLRYNNGTVETFNNQCFACAQNKTNINYYSAGACY